MSIRSIGPMFVLWGGAALASCAAPARHAAMHELPADGGYVRFARVRVAPAETKTFEELLESCADVAEAASLDQSYGWLTYLEPPGRYWVVSFAPTLDGFAYPTSDEPIRDVVRTMDKVAATNDLEARLDSIEYELEWNVLMRRTAEWSAGPEMNPIEYPNARCMVRSVRPGMESEFRSALHERVKFLERQGYELPVEGFVVLNGSPGDAIQVVFPTSWPAFHERESFWEFAQRLPEAAKSAYMERKGALMRTMRSAEYYDAKWRQDASFLAP